MACCVGEGVALFLSFDDSNMEEDNEAEESAEEKILDILLPDRESNNKESINNTRQILRKKFREGVLDEREIEISIPVSNSSIEIMTPPGMEDMASQLQNMFSNIPQTSKKSRKMKVKAAFKSLCEQEAASLINNDDLKLKAVHAAEQNGIVFIDELVSSNFFPALAVFAIFDFTLYSI